MAIPKVNLVGGLTAGGDGSLSAYQVLLQGIDHPTWGNGYSWTYVADTTADNVSYALSVNTDGTPSALVVSNSAGDIVNRQYSEDQNGNLTASVDNVIGPATTTGGASVGSAEGFYSDAYTYDFANRLTSMANSLGTQTYSLDSVGRITGTSFASGSKAAALGAETQGATSSITYDSNGRPEALNETDEHDGVTDDEQDMPTVTTDASGQAATIAQDDTGTESDGLTDAITTTFDQSGHLSEFDMVQSAGGSEADEVTVLHGTDSQYRQTQENVNVTIPGEGTIPVLSNTFYYGAGGEVLSVQGATSDCVGQSVDEARQDIIYLYGMPVAVLFSSDEGSPADCGLNFVVPNHLGAPLRLLDDSGNITQTPETGPYAAQGTTAGWNQSNGPLFSGILARYSTSTSDLIPLGGLGSYSSTTCSGPDCPATTYTQTVTEAGAVGIQLLLNIDGLDPCADEIQVQGNGAGDTAEIIPGTTTGLYGTATHLGNSVTLSVLSNTTLCGTDGCTCNEGGAGGSGFTITAATIQYSQATDLVGLSLPGMYNDQTGMLSNWNRYFATDPQIYLSPDPMMDKSSYMADLMKKGLWNPAYGYAGVDPEMFTDPDGLASKFPK